jgi:hypothetical protein
MAADEEHGHGGGDLAGRRLQTTGSHGSEVDEAELAGHGRWPERSAPVVEAVFLVRACLAMSGGEVEDYRARDGGAGQGTAGGRQLGTERRSEDADEWKQALALSGTARGFGMKHIRGGRG